MTCAHRACTCTTTSNEEFCSPACADGTDARACVCEHGECESSVAGTRTIDGDVFDPHTVAESVAAPTATPQYDGRP